jgi:hypothetical protein
VLRASEVAESIGIPSVTMLGSGFLKQAELILRGMGKAMPIAAYPGVPMVDSEETFRKKVEEQMLPAIIEGLARDKLKPLAPRVVEPEPGSVVFEGTLDEVEQHFHDKLWSDGLPVIPPTRERVDAFLACTDRRADEVIAVLPQESRAADILSIAVNGVMAGCRPEYMPLLIAVVELMADPQFRVEDAGSTPSIEPLIIVSGPIIGDLDLNSGQGVMKIGRQANSSIGRFLRLYLRNICGYRIPPGDGDKGSIGFTFNVALAENEDWARDIGWPTFGEEMGFAKEDSVVSIQSVVSFTSPTYTSGADAESHARMFVEAMGPTFRHWCYSGVKRGIWNPLFVIGPSIAKTIASQWTKDQLRDYLWRNMTMPAEKMEYMAMQAGAETMDFRQLVKEGLIPADYIASDDPQREVRMIVKPEHIGIVVAGDPGRNQSRGYMSNHIQAPRTSRRIDLPARWPQIMAGVTGTTRSGRR